MTASMDEEQPGVSPFPATSPVTGQEEAGDPACWAHRVCPECCRPNQAERAETCEACGTAFPAY